MTKKETVRENETRKGEKASSTGTLTTGDEKTTRWTSADRGRWTAPGHGINKVHRKNVNAD